MARRDADDAAESVETGDGSAPPTAADGGSDDVRTDDGTRREPTLDRRRVLALSGVAAAGALAGCGSGGDGDGGATSDPTADTSSAPSSTATETDAPPTTASPTATTAEPTTAEPTTTETPAELTDARQVLTAPSAHNHPLDGFSDADWLVEDADEIQIIPVTNLNANGPGSLQAAMKTPGPRIIVFEVGGVIDLAGDQLQVKPVETSLGGRDLSRMYIAGQTAPEPGITILRGEFSPYARNCIVQHVAVRPGDDIPKDYDAFSGGSLSENLILDHCSATWSVDECMSSDGGEELNGKTFSNNIIAKGLYDSVHAKGPHSKGTLLEENQTNFSIFGNVYSCNNERHPRMKGGVDAAFANNLVYNFGVAAGMGLEGEDAATGSFVSNQFIAGEDTDESTPIIFDMNGEHKPRAYEADTIVDGSNGLISRRVKRVDEKPLWPEALEPMPSDEVFEATLSNAGMRPAERASVDQDIVDQIRADDGRLIDSQEEAGGYPDHEPTERSLDPPEYGPAFAEWLAQHTRAVELGEEPPESA